MTIRYELKDCELWKSEHKDLLKFLMDEGDRDISLMGMICAGLVPILNEGITFDKSHIKYLKDEFANGLLWIAPDEEKTIYKCLDLLVGSKFW